MDTTLQSGYKYIELSRRQYDIGSRAEAILQSGIKVWSVHGYLDGRGISDDESVRRNMIDMELERIREAALYGKVPHRPFYTPYHSGKDYRGSLSVFRGVVWP